MENTGKLNEKQKKTVNNPIGNVAPHTEQLLDQLDKGKNYNDSNRNNKTQSTEKISTESITKSPLDSSAINVTDDNTDKLQELVSRTSRLQFGSSGIRGAYMSVVYSPQSIRLAINKVVNEKLGYPTEIYFGCEGDYLFMFNSEGTSFEGKQISSNNKGKLLIYDAALVKNIIETFNLDYSDVTSISFAEGYFEDKGRPVLYVKMV